MGGQEEEHKVQAVGVARVNQKSPGLALPKNLTGEVEAPQN